MSERPFLKGKRIVLTRPTIVRDPFVRELKKTGAKVLCVPAIRIEAPKSKAHIKKILRDFDTFDWIMFTSARSVALFLSELREPGIKKQSFQDKKIAAVGPATAKAVRAHGLTVNFIPKRFTGASLAEELDDLRGKRILLPRARRASADLPRILTSRGARVTDLALYETKFDRRRDETFEKLAAAKKIDYLIFTSPSTVHGLLAKVRSVAVRKAIFDIPTVVIGPITAAAIKKSGFKKVLVAKIHTTAGILKKLKDDSRKKSK